MPNLRKAAPHAASKILRGMRSCGNVLIQVRTTAASNVHHGIAVMGGVMRAADPDQEVRALLAIVAGTRR
jgi:hypothetical protein